MIRTHTDRQTLISESTEAVVTLPYRDDIEHYANVSANAQQINFPDIPSEDQNIKVVVKDLSGSGNAATFNGIPLTGNGTVHEVRRLNGAWQVKASSGGGGATDLTARALAQVDTMQAGEPVPAGYTLWALGKHWTNPTAGAINAPGALTEANILAAGFTEQVAASGGGGTTQTPAQIVAAVDANLGGTDWRTDPTLPAPTNYATAGTSVPEHIAGIDVALAPKSSNQIPVDFTGTNVMPQYPNVEEWLKALDESVSTLRGEIAAASGVIDTSTTSALLLTPSTPAATYNYELTLKSMEGSPVVTFSGPQGAAIDTVNDPRGVLTLAMLTGNAESVTIDGIASRLWGTIGIKINGASLGDIVFRDYAVGLGTFADAADDPEKAFRGALTSTGPGEDDGLGAFTQMSAPNQLFDPVKGMNPNDNRAVRALLSDPIRDKLFEQFTVGLEVETSYLDYETTRTKNTYLLSKTNGWTGVRADSTTDTRLDNLGGPLLVRGHFSPLDKGEFSDIRVTGDATHFEMYVDDLQVQRNVRERDVVTSYGTWYVGGLTTASTATMDGFHIRNAFGLTRVAGLDASRLESVGLLGDSFIAGSLLPDWAIDPDNDLHWYPGPGYAANGSPQGTATVAHYASATSRAHGDAGLVCQVFRYLSKNRYWPCGNANRSKSGDRITQAPAQFALMQGTDGVTPEAVVMQFGANDAAAPRAVADFDADYKAMLSTLDAAGVKYATVNQVITLSNDGAYGAANNTAVDEYNAAIAGFPAWAAAQGLSIRIGIVDLFADFGGHTPIADMFLAGDIHPSAKGSSHMGRKMGERLSALISTGL